MPDEGAAPVRDTVQPTLEPPARLAGVHDRLETPGCVTPVRVSMKF